MILVPPNRPDTITIKTQKKKKYQLRFATEELRVDVFNLLDALVNINQSSSDRAMELDAGELCRTMPYVFAVDWRSSITPENEAFAEFVTTAVFSKGDIITHEGTQYGMILSVVSGTCALVKDLYDEQIVVRQLGVEEIAGEVGFFLNCPAEASLIATGDCEMLLINSQFIQKKLFLESPRCATSLYFQITKILAERTSSGL